MKKRKFRKIMSMALAAVMTIGSLGIVQKPMEAYAVTQAGLADVSREVAAEGIVMLKNDNNALPLGGGNSIAKINVFGRVQIDYFECGYGSGGDVVEPYTVNLLDGLRGNGSVSVNPELASIYETWCAANVPNDGSWGNWPLSYPEMPLTDEQVASAAEYSDTALVIIGRSAGEDRETKLQAGSWYLTNDEKAMLSKVNDNFENVVVLINAGNLIDMSWTADYDNLDSILYVWQGGQESGNAIADVLSGNVSPSGKLSQTIANSYECYPSADNFGASAYTNYVEDIYVGYRYFETFAPDEVMYPFGYGMSYTDFEIVTNSVEEKDGTIEVDVTVTNTGDVFAGKEVVQIYYGVPQGQLGKASKSLAAYAKTNELAPGKSQDITLTFDVTQMASYDDAGKTGNKSAYVLEAGDYPIYVGNSVRDAKEAGVYTQDELAVTQQCTEANAVEAGFNRMINNNGEVAYEAVPTATVDMHDRIESALPKAITTEVTETIELIDVYNGTYSLDDFVAQLNITELEGLTRGDYTMGSSLGPSGNASVYGGTVKSLRDKGVVPVTTTDGPSGIRLSATASLVPIGTLLACTWNDNLIQDLYELVGKEMVLNGSDVILAPGMNLQRNPLCGRNFEYFSEDPLLTGMMGSNVVKGVQSQGVSACPKHFALNNQETNRNYNDSRCSERAQREIYLKAFEICVKTAKPLNIMSSYNKINGEWSYYNYDIMTTILRNEWGYDGVMMTDWWIKNDTCAYMGNTEGNAYRVRSQLDVLMPGEGPSGSGSSDKSLMNSYNTWVAAGSPEGTVDSGITLGELQRTAKNVLKFVMKSENFRTVNGLETNAADYIAAKTNWFEVDTIEAAAKPVISSITIDGKEMTAFDPIQKEYKIYVRDLSKVPVIDAVSEEGEVKVSQASADSGLAVVEVFNENGKTTYKIYFTNEADMDPVGENPAYAKITGIAVNGKDIYNYYPTIKSYTVDVESIADAVVTAKAPEGVDVIITKYDSYVVVRGETDDHATEYKILLNEKLPDNLLPKSDDFSGDGLNTDIWTLHNPDESHYRWTEDGLEITSQVGEFYESGDDIVYNYITQPAQGDWEAVVVLNYEIMGGQPYHQFGVLAMQDEDNYAGLKYECNDYNSGNWEMMCDVVETGADAKTTNKNTAAIKSFTNDGQRHDIWYKIRKVDDSYTLSFSVDGTTYHGLGTFDVKLNDVKLCIFTCNGMGDTKNQGPIADNIAEVPMTVKDVAITILDDPSEEGPTVIPITINGSEDGAVTYLKGTDRFYQYGPEIKYEASEDELEPEGGDGQIVAFIRSGYYLLFKVNVETAGHYTVSPRFAALDETGAIQYSYQLESDGEMIASFLHGATTGWKDWVNQEAKPIYLTEGEHTFRLLFNSADMNINYLSFIYTPDAHVWSDWDTVKEPTVDEEGIKERVCNTCGEKEQEPIDKVEVFAIITQPLDVTVDRGTDATIFVEATGEGLTYQWYYKNPGNKKFYTSDEQFVSDDGTVYSIPMLAWRDGQEVYCVVTDKTGASIQSNTVTLTMDTGTIKIIEQPVDTDTAKGEQAVVSVAATGEGLTYEWYYKNPGNKKFYISAEQFVIDGGTTYSIPMAAWRDGQQVYCVITDINGDTVQTNTVTLTMTK